MNHGKPICDTLKSIRKQIADANDIPYAPIKCALEEDCLGTCPTCESEMRYIEDQLNIRKMAGKAVKIVGLATVMTLASCNDVQHSQPQPSGENNAVDTIKLDSVSADSSFEGISEPIDTPPPPPPLPDVIPCPGYHPTKEEMDSWDAIDEAREDTAIFSIVEEKAQYPQGTDSLKAFILNNLKYPSDACVQGRVVIAFVVEKDGSITNVDIVRSVHPAFDEEAVRFVSMMPKWIPAKNNGKIVRSRYYLPILLKYK
ncbi:MAG: energy transducer TonB [Bacteroidales bacterium]|jgi:TonB family protein|nr:energy transducer TonB [Bacteroidales bacterium]